MLDVAAVLIKMPYCATALGYDATRCVKRGCAAPVNTLYRIVTLITKWRRRGGGDDDGSGCCAKNTRCMRLLKIGVVYDVYPVTITTMLLLLTDVYDLRARAVHALQTLKLYARSSITYTLIAVSKGVEPWDLYFKVTSGHMRAAKFVYKFKKRIKQCSRYSVTASFSEQLSWWHVRHWTRHEVIASVDNVLKYRILTVRWCSIATDLGVYTTCHRGAGDHLNTPNVCCTSVHTSEPWYCLNFNSPMVASTGDIHWTGQIHRSFRSGGLGDWGVHAN